jgi:prepilin-type N-terminal cleavage/methylation domain-containing protein
MPETEKARQRILGTRRATTFAHRGKRGSASHRDTPRGFTLVEMLVAISLIATVMAITFTTFYSVSNAWQKGLRTAENLNHGEYIMDQLVNGLRSSFYPCARTNGGGACYGFDLKDGGEGPGSRDSFQWVKTGGALLGLNDPLRKGVHRIQVSVEEDEDGYSCVATRTWRPYGNPDGFLPEQINPFFAASKIEGIGCRVSTNRGDDGWEWESAWENDATNRLPLAVEITLYLEPMSEDDDPVEMKRLIEIPVAPLSWQGTKGRRK